MIRLLRRKTEQPAKLLQTPRLQLIPITVALVQVEAASLSQLGEALRCQVTRDWPPDHWEPHVYEHIAAQLTGQPETVGYHRYIVLKEQPRLLVGTLGAFPGPAGDVEMGYSVVTSFQRRGIATEAVRALVPWLLSLPAVHSVSAQTFLAMPQSIKVMERSGLLPAGAGDEPETVRYRRWK